MTRSVPGAVNHPGVVRLHVRHLLGHAQASVLELADIACALARSPRRNRVIHRPLCSELAASVTIVEQIDALVVREEGLAGMKACRGGERSSPSGARVVREVRRIDLGPENHMMPTGVPSAGCDNEELFELGEWNRIVP